MVQSDTVRHSLPQCPSFVRPTFMCIVSFGHEYFFWDLVLQIISCMSNGKEIFQRASQCSCQFNACKRLAMGAHVVLKKSTGVREHTQHIHAGLGFDMEAYIKRMTGSSERKACSERVAEYIIWLHWREG